MNIGSYLSSLLIGSIISLFSVSFTIPPNDSSATFSGSVEGTAILAPKNRSVRSGGSLYGRPTPSNTTQSSSDSILVVLKGTSSNSLASTKAQYLNQKNQQFVPSILPVSAGGTVRIQNSDPVYHNVFSLTSPNKFDVGRRPKGEFFDVRFEKPGVVDVFCDIHSNMYAIIYVLPPGTISFTKIKSGDSFSFSEIQDGTYELTLYALGYKEVNSQILLRNGQTHQAGTITLNP
mgnify:CR=1 FL=1|tara:strand:+ start:57546 stop:58244 length:699 start_codon:yes stop_codon:yes gene_type:complete